MTNDHINPTKLDFINQNTDIFIRVLLQARLVGQFGPTTNNCPIHSVCCFCDISLRRDVAHVAGMTSDHPGSCAIFTNDEGPRLPTPAACLNPESPSQLPAPGFTWLKRGEDNHLIRGGNTLSYGNNRIE